MPDVISDVLQNGGPYAVMVGMIALIIWQHRSWRKDLKHHAKEWKEKFEEEHSEKNDLEESIRESKNRDMQAVGELKKAVEQMLHTWGGRREPSGREEQKTPPTAEQM